MQPVTHLEILSGWKEVASYLGKGVRTVQRYERELGLPIRRPAARKKGAVICTKAELDAWITAKPIREGLRLSLPAVDNTAIFKRFTQQMEEMNRLILHATQLRSELAACRNAMSAVTELLHKNLRGALPGEDPILSFSKPRRTADVLLFGPKRKIN